MEIDIICSGTGGSFLSMAGALDAIRLKGLKVGQIACTSGSSIPAAFICGLGIEPMEVLSLAINSSFEELIKRKIWNPITSGSLYTNNELENWIDRKTNSAKLKDVRVKTFAVNAVDINSGEMFVFSNHNEPDMPLSKAIIATIGIPGIFPPVYYKGRWFVDGGVNQNLLVGIFDNSENKKLALIEVDENETKVDISSKLYVPLIEVKGKKPGIFSTAALSIKHLMAALLRAQLEGIKNTHVINVPAIKTKHDFFLTKQEKIELFEQARDEVLSRLEKL